MRCSVTIESVGKGILFRNPVGLAKEQGNKSARKKEYIPAEEADLSCYWNKDHTEIGFPGDCIRACLIRAASGLKVPGNKKLALAPIIAGDVTIVEEWIGFGTDKYEIDTRRVIINRQGVLRSRAWLLTWKLTFTVEWETSLLGKDFYLFALNDLLTIGGERIGIGDYRPACKGPFGKFRVVDIFIL